VLEDEIERSSEENRKAISQAFDEQPRHCWNRRREYFTSVKCRALALIGPIHGRSTHASSSEPWVVRGPANLASPPGDKIQECSVFGPLIVTVPCAAPTRRPLLVASILITAIRLDSEITSARACNVPSYTGAR
jgi:hypothetical protein